MRTDRITHLLFVLFTLVLVVPVCFAQTDNASISGRVTDPSGSVVTSATIELQNVERGTVTKTATNETGIYVFPAVRPGVYHMSVSKQGFHKVDFVGLTVNTQDHIEQNFALTVGAVSESVTVESNAIAVEPSAAVGTTVDNEFVKGIPLNGRTFQSLLMMTPGMVFSTGEQGQISVNGGRTDTNYFTVDGASANFGAGVQSLYDQSAGGAIPGFNSFGSTQNLLSLDAMQEIKIQTSSYSAEFGRQPGAQVSLVSKSGTNNYHGTISEYLRNSATDANYWFSDQLGKPKVPNRANNFGATFGGPVRIPGVYNDKDKTFFFFSYEGVRTALPQPAASFNVPAACLHNNPALNPQVQALMNAFPVPNNTPGSCATTSNGIGTFVTSWNNFTNMDSFSLRLDQTFGTRWNLFIRANHAFSESRVYNLAQLAHWPVKTDTETLGLTTQVTHAMTNVFRANFSRSIARNTYEWTTAFGGQPIDNIKSLLPPGVPDYAVPYFLVPGGRYEVGPYTYHRQAQINAVDNATYQLGPHSITFGTDLRWMKPLYVDNGYIYQISLTNVGNLLQNMTSSGSLITSIPIEALVRNTSFYVNDSWRASRHLTLSLGLRWDINPAASFGQYHLPTFTGFPDVTKMALNPTPGPLYPTPMKEFAPRLGAAYSLHLIHGWDTVVRGGWGIFYDLGQGTGLATSHSFPFSLTQSITALPFPLAANTFPPATLPYPLTAPYGPPTGVVTFGVFNSNYVLPRTQQYTFSIQQQLGREQLLTVSFVGNHGQNLLMRYQYNYPNATVNPNFKSGTRLYITRNDGDSAGFSYYNGLQVQFMRRMAKGLQVMANYTWSHGFDTFSNDSSFNPGANPTDVLKEIAANGYGTSDYDRRHIFNLAAVYAIPKLHPQDSFSKWLTRIFTNGWETSYNYKYQSGMPYSLVYYYYDIANGQGATAYRVDQVPGVPTYITNSYDPTGHSLNPAAFAIPTRALQVDPGQAGNGTSARNMFVGPGLSQLDFSIRRVFTVSERVKLQFSAELFNALNHPNFAAPNTIYGYVYNTKTGGATACPGTTTAVSGVSCTMYFPETRLGGTIAATSAFGEITTLANGISAGGSAGYTFDISLNPRYSIGGPRSSQFALRLTF
jgi:hypothetical protein